MIFSRKIKTYISYRHMPINIQKKDIFLFEKEFEKKYRKPFFKVKTNCFLSNSYCVIYNFSIFQDDKFISLNSKINSISLKCRIILRAYFKRDIIHVENGIIAIDSWSNGYYHWVTDILTKLISLPEFYSSYYLLLPNNYKGIEFIEQSLNLLNFKKIFYYDKFEVLKIKELVIPGIMANTGNYNDEIVRLLRKKILATFEKVDIPKLKLLILRKSSIARNIINENAVIDLMNKYGFQTVYFEEKTLDEQIKLIINCSILAAVHGAGLTNMLYLNKNAKVMEFRRKDDFQNNCYYSLASALELEYYYHLCDVDDINKSTQNNNFIININELENSLKEMS